MQYNYSGAAKQQMSSQKGLASTVDVNLRPVPLAHHAKLESKLGQSSKQWSLKFRNLIDWNVETVLNLCLH